VYTLGAGPNVAALKHCKRHNHPSTNSLFHHRDRVPSRHFGLPNIDNILVDTGIRGLRVLQSVVEPLVLPALRYSRWFRSQLRAFLDMSFLWGPVEVRDIKIVARPPPILNSSDQQRQPNVANRISQGGSVNENTPQILGPMGIWELANLQTAFSRARTSATQHSPRLRLSNLTALHRDVPLPTAFLGEHR